jgi:hypothetical protein
MPEGRRTDVDLRTVALLGAVLVGIVAAVAVTAQLTIGRMARRSPPGHDRRSPLAVEAPPPEPRLQTAPADDMAALRAREDSILHSYGWVDRAHEIVRVPIDEAKKKILEKGLPSR